MLRPGLKFSTLLWLCSATSTAIAHTTVSGVPRSSSSNSTTSPSTFNDGQYVPWQPPATNNGENTPLSSDPPVLSTPGGPSATPSLPASNSPINTENATPTSSPSLPPSSPSSLPAQSSNSPMNTDNSEIEKSTLPPSSPPSGAPSPSVSNSPINTENASPTSSPSLPPPSTTSPPISNSPTNTENADTTLPPSSSPHAVPSSAANSSPTTEKTKPIISPSKSSTTASTTEVNYGLATQITVSKPPTLCTASNYKWEKKMTLPTPGVVLILAGKTGWGEVDDIWEIRAGPGAKLVEVSAKAQGSSGTSVNPNQESDSEVQQRKDGSWFMRVTENMQPSLKIRALLIGEDTPAPSSDVRRRGRPSLGMRKRDVPAQKLSLTVSGMPKCGLPIAGNCTQRGFQADQTQWEAFQVDEFMEWWVEKNDITDFQTFRAKAYEDFVEPNEDRVTICDIGNPVTSCEPPTRGSCASLPGLNETKGWIMASGTTQFTRFLSTQWHNVDNLRGVINTDIHQIVKNNWVNSAKQTKAKILSLTGALMGLIVAACVALTVLMPEAAWAGWAVAGAILAQTAVSTSGAVVNMLDPDSSDAQFTKSTEWEKQADDTVVWLRNGIMYLHETKTSPKNITDAMKGGRWVSDEVVEVFNKDGSSLKGQDWFEKSIGSSFITKALEEEDAWIAFFPFDDKVDYNGKAWKQGAFNKKMCEDNFVGNDNWKYYASCDIPFGDEEGMAVVTRPESKGSESKSWMEEPLSFGKYEIKGTDIMRSAMVGQAEHGFNYTLLNEDFADVMMKDISVATKLFSDSAVDQPGLFQVPVCVVRDDLVYVPGIQKVMKGIYDTPGSEGYYHYDAPVPCKDYESDKGDKRKFTDHVSDTVRDSFDTKLKGQIFSNEIGDSDDDIAVGGF